MAYFEQYTQHPDDLYTHPKRNFNDAKSTFLLYNGAPDPDDDPADYYPLRKVVYIA